MGSVVNRASGQGSRVVRLRVPRWGRKGSGKPRVGGRRQSHAAPLFPWEGREPSAGGVVWFGVLILGVLQGPDKGRKFELPDHEPQLIGRSSEALPMNDNAVSRRHAELTPDDGAWYIRDLKSQNGTYVNGQRISDRTRLRLGDQVRVGQSLLVFGAGQEPEDDVVRVVGSRNVDATIEKTLPSVPLKESLGSAMDDSVILSEPEPRAAAAEHLRVIYRLTTLLSQRGTERQELLSGVLELVFAEVRPQRGCIVLCGASPDLPVTPAVVKYRESPVDPEDARIEVSRTILQHTITKGEGVLSANAMQDPRFASGDSVQRLNIRSAICAPIRFQDRTFGAIYIDSSIANYTFTPEQLALMNAIGQHAGLALSNAELYQQKLQGERLAVIGETVASLSHAIKNILQGMRGGADVVEMGLKKDDLKIAKGGWGILQRNLDRIISLTMNMLAFSRQRRVELELVQVVKLVEDCVQVAEAQAAARQVAVIADLDSEIPPIMLDASLIHQAVLNLVTNAVEAVSPGSGVVIVKTQYRPAGPGLPAAQLEISVRDNGPGIPPSKQPWIFQPFNTTKGLRGTGLGLAVAKRVAEEHMGRIVLESAEGKGATFRIIVPAESGPHADPAATTSSRTRS